MTEVAFNQMFRDANTKRLIEFKNGKGEAAHKEHDGSDWSMCDWTMALIGEVGELANMLKKHIRGDIISDPAVVNDHVIAVLHEIADCVIYLDLIAFRLKQSPLTFNVYDPHRPVIGKDALSRCICEINISLALLSSYAMLNRVMSNGSWNHLSSGIMNSLLDIAMYFHGDDATRTLERIVCDKWNISSAKINYPVRIYRPIVGPARAVSE